jgi:hypothetical protein
MEGGEMTIKILCPHCAGRFTIRTTKDEKEIQFLKDELNKLKTPNPFDTLFPGFGGRKEPR